MSENLEDLSDLSWKWSACWYLALTFVIAIIREHRTPSADAVEAILFYAGYGLSFFLIPGAIIYLLRRKGPEATRVRLHTCWWATIMAVLIVGWSLLVGK